MSVAAAWRDELRGLGEAGAPSALWPRSGSGLNDMLGVVVVVVDCVSGVVDVGGERVFRSGAIAVGMESTAMI